MLSARQVLGSRYEGLLWVWGHPRKTLMRMTEKDPSDRKP